MQKKDTYGMYKDDSGYVYVSYNEERISMPISREMYENNEYEPPYDELPTEHDYKKSKADKPSEQ